MSTYVEQFDYSVNLLQALLWQYDSAVNLISLMTQKQTWYDTNQQDFWTDWYTNVFNLETCNQFGLTLWSIILDVPDYVPAGNTPLDSTRIFGFNNNSAYPTLENTYQNFVGLYTPPPALSPGGNFYPIGGTRLSLAEQRLLLRIRYYQLTSNGNTTQINVFMNWLFENSPDFPAGNYIWAIDDFNMTIGYVFSTDFPLELLTALTASDVLPRPAGVGITYL
jgi:hypothetical protein